MRINQTLKEYMQDYKQMLDYLDKELTICVNFEDEINLKMIKDHIRTGFFSKWQDYVSRYFYPYDESFGHLEDCEMFLFENHTRAIRNFNGYWYVVGVESINSVGIRTESPDDYPTHILPKEGQSYPEYLIADYLIKRGLGD